MRLTEYTEMGFDGVCARCASCSLQYLNVSVYVCVCLQQIQQIFHYMIFILIAHFNLIQCKLLLNANRAIILKSNDLRAEIACSEFELPGILAWC